VLISFDAESPAEVDEIAQKVTAAGGVIYAQPGESEGWMYACGFCDPDGHRWNPLFMDMSKMNG
jgi:predicted lactoylglutathione lyase